jgi:hypothetical protein
MGCVDSDATRLVRSRSRLPIVPEGPSRPTYSSRLLAFAVMRHDGRSSPSELDGAERLLDLVPPPRPMTVGISGHRGSHAHIRA